MAAALRKSMHTERYRVVYDQAWPRKETSVHNARYFEDEDLARAAYLHNVVSQLMGERGMARLALEESAGDGYYRAVLVQFADPAGVALAGARGEAACPSCGGELAVTGVSSALLVEDAECASCGASARVLTPLVPGQGPWAREDG